ncbi:hypothetical protein [Salipiger mucosus]|uniref:Lipoprotein n=1 Tax=Salipiger mucosus DSM 16094 TaxID=1123237 RepID=S9QZR1_9RHOB|nr:hypothetical protein [Salipiger mucosus]EPX85163.1 hypothetical protein Salmuc_01119 [Salipiger mucosus DSM 16094]
MFNRILLAGAVALGALAGCAQPEPVVIGPEPVADKYGALHCPGAYVLQGDVCVPLDTAMPPSGNGMDGVEPGTADAGGMQNRTRNTNQNTNQTRNTYEGG